VRCELAADLCLAEPAWRRSGLVMSMPSNRIVPRVGRCRQTTKRATVGLPQPDSPPAGQAGSLLAGDPSAAAGFETGPNQQPSSVGLDERLPRAHIEHAHNARNRRADRKKGAVMSIRPVKRVVQSKPTMEGAGVKLHRAFGFGDTGEFDPFLLFDDFRNDRPDDYRAGFPWHPHRGIETITYVLAGSVDHGDSLGNRGTLAAGDVQWMTAGSGILHQEMPQGDPQGRMHGFQLWANLPSSLKMTAPRYQDVAAAAIPEIVDDDGTIVRVVCGDFWGKRGPVDGIAAEPRYLDIFVPAGRRKTLPVETWRHAFAYVFEGSGTFRGASEPFGVLTEKGTPDSEIVVREQTGNRSLVLFDTGDEVTVQAGEHGIRFLLISGKPLEEPVAWYGPIVMNTQAELRQALADLRDGTFIRQR
jgi:quercetin 2,3-dioxygenase